MLSVRISRGLAKQPVIVEDAQTVIIEDRFGHPLHAFVVLNENNILSLSPADSKFHEIIASMGLNKRCDYEVKNAV